MLRGSREGRCPLRAGGVLKGGPAVRGMTPLNQEVHAAPMCAGCASAENAGLPNRGATAGDPRSAHDPRKGSSPRRPLCSGSRGWTLDAGNRDRRKTPWSLPQTRRQLRIRRRLDRVEGRRSLRASSHRGFSLCQHLSHAIEGTGRQGRCDDAHGTLEPGRGLGKPLQRPGGTCQKPSDGSAIYFVLSMVFLLS